MIAAIVIISLAVLFLTATLNWLWAERTNDRLRAALKDEILLSDYWHAEAVSLQRKIGKVNTHE